MSTMSPRALDTRHQMCGTSYAAIELEDLAAGDSGTRPG